jgi:hypothetical protein
MSPQPDMSRISNYLSELKQAGLSRTQALAPAAERVLHRAQEARLSPFDLLSLGGFAVATTGAAAYLLACSFGPVASAVTGAAQWRAPSAAAAPRRSADVQSPPDAQTLKRPLFAKSRRPTERGAQPENPSPIASAQVETPPAGMALKGVVNHGEDTRVFIVTNALAEGVWLKPGEAIEGWTIESARKSDVTLRKGDHVAHLEFEYNNEPPAFPGIHSNPFTPPEPSNPLKGKGPKI